MVVKGAPEHRVEQGSDYQPGVSAETTGSTVIWLGRMTLPPGGRTKAHVHEHHETALYMMSGDVLELWTGDELEHCDRSGPATTSISRRTCCMSRSIAAPRPPSSWARATKRQRKRASSCARRWMPGYHSRCRRLATCFEVGCGSFSTDPCSTCDVCYLPFATSITDIDSPRRVGSVNSNRTGRPVLALLPISSRAFRQRFLFVSHETGAVNANPPHYSSPHILMDETFNLAKSVSRRFTAGKAGVGQSSLRETFGPAALGSHATGMEKCHDLSG